MSALLTLENLSVDHRAHRVLASLDLEVAMGEVVVVAGANGSGKTTLLDAISGFVRPSAGRVAYRGKEITGIGPANRGRMGIARTFQDARLFPSMPVRDILGIPVAAASDAVIIERFDPLRFETLFAFELSAGERRLLELHLAFARSPQLMLLDEPSSGLGTAEASSLASVIGSRKDRTAFLVTEHDIRFAEKIADRILYLDEAKLSAGAPEHSPASVPKDAVRIASRALQRIRAVSSP